MTTKELEALIDERSAKQIAEAKETIKKEIGEIANGVDEKKFNEAVEKAVKEIQKQNKADKNANTNMLLNFEKANAENAVKGLKAETPKSVVNEMIGSALFAMEKFNHTNVKQVTGDELLATAKEKYANSKALHAVIEQKALNTGTNSEGGFTVPVAFSGDYIKALYANTILEKLGVSKVPLVNGNLSIPKMTAGATAYWVGETQKITASQATFGQVNMKAKKLACLSPLSNELLRYNAVGLDSWIADDLMMKAKIALDSAFLNGSGTNYTPKGLSNLEGIQTTGGSTSVLGVTTPIDMVAMLEQANIPMNNVKWLSSPIMKSWLAGKAFASGPFAWADELARTGKLNGYDVVTSATVGGVDSESNTADIWLGDFSQLLWGVGSDITIEMSREATFDTGDGTLVSAFQNDLTLIRLITEHDFACRNENAFVKGTFKKA